MTASLVRGWEVVIGFETHAQLSTQSKIFSRASTAFGAEPNTQASPVDIALPGTLPVMNRGAVERAIAFGLAVNARVAPRSIFARKNYFYPDLPKGYQISQYEIPVVQGGVIDFVVEGTNKRVRLVRAHLEEDAGKSLHDNFVGLSGIDLNRAGTPLLEIVTEPDLHSSDEAVAYAKELHKIVTWIGICDGNMQEGSFRCDANVSIHKPGTPLGTRREIKNLNSFEFMKQAIDFEIEWQIDELEAGRVIEQATVLFDPASGETRAMRTKEDAADYRYFPDPDLPPLVIDNEWIERVRKALPESPVVTAIRFRVVDGLSPQDAEAMTQSLSFARYYERLRDACGQPKAAANWLMGEVSRKLNLEQVPIHRCPIQPEALGLVIRKVEAGEITRVGAKKIFDELWANTIVVPLTGEVIVSGQGAIASQAEARGIAETIEKIILDHDLRAMNDSGALEKIVDEVVAANPDNVAQYKSGKEKAFNALVGQVMKASRGKANPQQVNELLKKRLG